MKLRPREFVSRLGQQITCVLRVLSIRNISFTLLFFSLISFHTLFIMICEWYQFPYIFRRRFTNTHIHTHTHLCHPCSVKAPPPPTVYGKCVFLSSEGLDEVMQLVLVSCPWPCIFTIDRDREQCSVGRRGRAVTEMTQRFVAGQRSTSPTPIHLNNTVSDSCYSFLTIG